MMQPLTVTNSSKARMAIISLLFSATTSCPKQSRFPRCIGGNHIQGWFSNPSSSDPHIVFPSIANTSSLVSSAMEFTQSLKHFLNCTGSNAAKTFSISCEGILRLSGRYCQSQDNFRRPNIVIDVKSSIPWWQLLYIKQDFFHWIKIIPFACSAGVFHDEKVTRKIWMGYVVWIWKSLFLTLSIYIVNIKPFPKPPKFKSDFPGCAKGSS